MDTLTTFIANYFDLNTLRDYMYIVIIAVLCQMYWQFDVRHEEDVNNIYNDEETCEYSTFEEDDEQEEDSVVYNLRTRVVYKLN